MAKQCKRKAERKFAQSRLELDPQIYRDHCKVYKRLLDTAKITYHRSTIIESGPSDLFRIVNKLSNPNLERTLPSCKSPTELADRFANYFEEKIDTFRNDIDSVEPPVLSVNMGETCCSSFVEFRELTPEEVSKLIMDSPTKSCALDCFPTWLLKKSQEMCGQPTACYHFHCEYVASIWHYSALPKDRSSLPHLEET